MPASFEGLHESVLEVLKNNEWAFRTGVVRVGDARMLNGETRPFDAEYITERLNFPTGRTPRAVARAEYATTTITRVLERLAEDSANFIVLRFKAANNPNVIHIDTVVMEFLNKHQFELIMEHAEREVMTDKGPMVVSGPFDAAFIAWKLGLDLNPVVRALRRLAADSKSFIGLTNADPMNPAPIRDYGVSCDTTYAAAIVG